MDTNGEEETRSSSKEVVTIRNLEIGDWKGRKNWKTESANRKRFAYIETDLLKKMMESGEKCEYRLKEELETAMCKGL